MTRENRAIIDMLVCATLWSLAGIFIKLIPWNALAITGFRSLIAGVTVVVYIAAKGYRVVINKRTLLPGVLMAIVYYCFVGANKLTTSANAIVLQFTAPIFIVVFSSVIYKKQPNKKDVAAVAATFVGISLFFLDKLETGYVIGNFVAIFAGMFMAAMYMTMGDAEGEEKFSAILLGQIIAFVGSIPFIVITKPEFSITPIIAILILGVFQLGSGYILYAKSSLYCPPLACCLLGAIEPLLNPVWVAIFDGEKPGVFALMGGIIVITAVTVWCIMSKKDDGIATENKGTL